MGDKWPLQHRHVLGQAIRIRSPYVDALSVTQVLALRSLRKKVDKEELSQSQQAGFCFASMFVRQVRQCFSAVWADGFPRCR
ncbi:hypothetical protein, partial [Bifidobacterium longum]|uniref:hypothetical protein n=1 Tax=Bifidobacterium longum TaxID=216816 RepID=UPI00319E3EF1